MFFSQYFSFPCQYHSTIAPYSFIHLPPTLYNVFLPVLQFPLSVSFHHCSILIHSSTCCSYLKVKLSNPVDFPKSAISIGILLSLVTNVLIPYRIWNSGTPHCVYRWYMFFFVRKSSVRIVSKLNVCQLSTISWRHQAHSFVWLVTQVAARWRGERYCRWMIYYFLHLISHLCVLSLIHVQEISCVDSRGKHNTALSGGAQHYQQINWRESKSPGQLPYVPHFLFLLRCY